MNNHPILDSLGACSEGVAFADQFSDLQSAWLACERGDWLLWFAAKRNVDRRVIVSAACACARLLPGTKDPRVRKCIEITEAWTRGEATIEDVRGARIAAYAAVAADAARTAHAAAAAADAAAAARTAHAAAAAADAAHAAAAAYAAAVRRATLKKCADIVRTFISEAP